jgi:hypothetical protein
MRKLILGIASAAVATVSMAGDIGISLNIGEPGFFGQINIGGIPQPPPLVYAQPVTVTHVPGYVEAPIYLHVPPGHEKYWSRHCGEYNACGRPVYFVRDDWYQREYVPRYQRGEWGHESVDRHHDEYRGHEHGAEHEYGHGDHDHDHDHDRDHDR